ncbi:MAG: tRNA guanosine(34) transglycosylase Tgt [candidate division Zixibacteria bacterium]|nr:tRNA guanosine(34) transglycosylase Tgt [candidate division Zixibacteria bacterium]
MNSFDFKIVKKDEKSSARAGRLDTPHGEINTPVFMPVGTQASIKTLCSKEMEDLGAELILGNTYHLYLRPGHKLIERAGGLHSFMSWKKPMLTDSGGYQVFSLNPLAKVTEEGVNFKSYIDGSSHQFTPEKVIEIEHSLGADIIMPLDECVPYPSSYPFTRRATEFTMDWAKRSKFEHEKNEKKEKQTLFGIVQGGIYPNLRELCASFMVDLDFSGLALGGLSVGEPKDMRLEVIEQTLKYLPEDKPRYLMGVGTPEDIVEGVSVVVDMFDCVLPTRNARNGTIFTRKGKMIIKAARYAEDFSPIDENCSCLACRNYSRAYIRHLFQSGEIAGLRLATIHSLHFYLSLMREIRESILQGIFIEWRKDFLEEYNSSNSKGEETQ